MKNSFYNLYFLQNTQDIGTRAVHLSVQINLITDLCDIQRISTFDPIIIGPSDRNAFE